MIPIFPNFKPLEFSDKDEIESCIELYPPYSDFEFASLWSWNIKEDMEVSWLNDNLVIRFTDYVTGSPFYTFLGDKNTSDTADRLLRLSEENKYGSILNLVPEISTQNLNLANFDVFESREHFDYIYNVKEHITYSGGKLKARRNFLNSFLKNYPEYKAKLLDLGDERTKEEILNLCSRWEDNKGYSIPNESEAHKRFLRYADRFSYTAIGIFVEDRLIGYCTTVLLKNGNANALFEKIDTNYHGVHALLRSEVAKDLDKRGYPYLNYEQDLGIDSLRRSKLAFSPSFFLKKYTVSKKQQGLQELKSYTPRPCWSGHTCYHYINDMKDLFRTAFRNPLAEIGILIFSCLLIWWVSLHFLIEGVGPGSGAFLLWGASYQIIAWYGAIIGFFIAHRWGGTKSYIGKAITAFALGLLFQSFGQTAYTWYIYILQIPIPYPSIGDIGFFGSIPCYFYGAFMLSKASGAKISIRSYGSKIQAFLIPLALLVFSYYMFLGGYEFDLTQPLKIFLDFGYPLGQAIYVSTAIVAFLLSRKLLGGIMRLPVLFFIVALIAQYFCDSTFLYEAAHGAYYPANINDLMYCISYTLMTISIAYVGAVFNHIKDA